MLATAIGNYNDPVSIGSRLRRRRAGPLAELIERTHLEKGCCSILDLGGTETYWNIFDDRFLRDRNCRITLLNRNKTELRNPAVFKAVVGDACAVDAADNSFDIVHSNSVIEHVGNWCRTKAFSREVRRLAPSHFVQTPNFWFPWEPHFGVPLFQFLPFQMRVSLLLGKKCGFYRRCRSLSEAIESVEEIRLLSRRMMVDLFPDSQIIHERLFGMTKSFIAIRRKSIDVE